MNKKLRRLLAICCMIFICLSTINVPTVKAAEEDTSDDSLTFVEVIEEMPTQPSLSRATKTKLLPRLYTVMIPTETFSGVFRLSQHSVIQVLPANAHPLKLQQLLIVHIGRRLCPVAQDPATKQQQLQLEKVFLKGRTASDSK